MDTLEYIRSENYLSLNECCNTQYSMGTMSTAGSSTSDHSYSQFSPDSTDGYQLEIVEQPADYRFRYRKEKYHGYILGMKSPSNKKKGLMTFPKVKLHHFEGEEAVLRCWLVTAGSPEPHFHQLARQINKKTTLWEPIDLKVNQANNYTATYEHLFIIHGVTTGMDDLEMFQKKVDNFLWRQEDVKNVPRNRTDNKEAIKNMDKNQAVLYFKAYDAQSRRFLCEAVSRTIKNLHNAETGLLKISRCFQNYGCCQGGDQIIIFVEKVTKDVKIRFFEKGPLCENTWSDYAKFANTDIHHQVAIVFRTPPYKDHNIVTDVKVYFELFREGDSEVSEPVEFIYRPTDVFKPVSCGKKRRLQPPTNQLVAPPPLPSHPLQDCMIQSLNIQAHEINISGVEEENGQAIWRVPVSPQLPPDSSTPTCLDDLLYSPERQENEVYPLMCPLEVRQSNLSPLLLPDTTHPSSTDMILEMADENLSFLEGYNLSHLGDDLCFDLRRRTESEGESEEDDENDEKKIKNNEEHATEETAKKTASRDIRLAADSLLTGPPRQVQTRKPPRIPGSQTASLMIKENELDLLSAIFYNMDILVINNLLKSAEVNQVDTFGNSALHIAAKSGRAGHLDLLFKYNIDTDLRNMDGDDGLLCAARYNKTDSVKVLLLVHKLNPNVQNLKNKETPLHWAVVNNNVELVKFLLKYGADPYILNRGGLSPHDFASLNECDFELKDVFSQHVLKGVRNELQRPDLFCKCNNIIVEASSDTEDEEEFSSANDGKKIQHQKKSLKKINKVWWMEKV